MKKRILLLFCLFLVTGCNATYNLEIEYDEFKEKLEVDSVVTNINNLILPLVYDVDEYDADVKPGSEGFYDASMNDNGFSLFHTFKYREFLSSTMLNSCYDKVDVKYNKNNIYVSTVGSFSCFERYDDLHSLTVKISSKYKLVASNADKIDGFDYIWYIDNNNLDKGIYVEFDTTGKKMDIMGWLNDNGILVFIFQFVLILLLALFMLFMKKKNDEDEMF